MTVTPAPATPPTGPTRPAVELRRHRTWRPTRPLDVAATWGPLRRGPADPCWRVVGGALWRGITTPDGTVTLRLETRTDERRVEATAWGAGAGWILDRLPTMLGEEDDPDGFRPGHPLLDRARRRHRGWRVPRTGLVMEALVPAILEQKVTGQEAWAGWRALVRRFSEPAPGPGAGLGLWVPPAPRVLSRVPSWEWLAAGVGPSRSATILRAAAVADRLEELVGMDAAGAHRRLTAVPGIGVWTAAETAHRALGDADAVSFGDYHVAADLGWALTGHPVDDRGLAELLRPWAGHRYRVQRLLELSGVRRPRRGPRAAPRTHLPTVRR